MQEAVEILKELQADKGAKVTLTKATRVEKRPGVEEMKFEESPYIFRGTLNETVSEEKIEKIAEKMFQKQIYCDLEVPLPIGGPFSNYGEIDNVLDEGKTELAHKPGEVLLVDVWATWCPPCQKPMAHNQEMLEKNAETWKDRVRIVGVSVDDSKDTIKERVESKKWDRVVHLTLLGWQGEHALIKDFKVQGIPFVCLVDKFGKINYAGHPMGINLETRINELLAVEKQGAAAVPQAKATPDSTTSKEEIEKILISLQKEKLQEFLKNFYLCCLNFSVTESFQNSSISSKIEIKATTLEGDAAALQSLKSFFGQFKCSELKVETVKYLDVPYDENLKCWKCDSVLNYPFYWLKWEEGKKFGCRECVQAKSTEEGHHYAYEQNSILLIGKWDKIAEKNMGKNIQPKDLKSQTDTHRYCCNACGSCSDQIGDARYICLGCRADPNPNRDYDDLCVPCMQKLIKGDAQVIEALKPDNHCPSHPFLRILYSTGDYYTF